MKSRLILFLLTACVISVGDVRPPTRVHAMNAHVQCGKERWDVKTLRDTDARRIDWEHSVETTVQLMTEIPAPKQRHDTGRLSFVERTIYHITAVLVGYKLESDGDYHIVIGDPITGATMIAEIPSPDCMPEVADGLQQLRNTVASLTATKHKIKGLMRPDHRVLISISGVGFFDFIHGQTGVAPNGVELHPVFDVQPSTKEN